MPSKNAKLIAVAFMLTPVLLLGSPVPKIDSVNFDAGVLKEADLTIFKHTFRITNIGDSVLTIPWVRAGCGCTAVSYDSIIPPGKTGNVVAEVNMENFPEGPFEKTVKIGFNNDKYSPTSVAIRAVRQHIVNTEPDRVRFASGKGQDTGAVVIIRTDEKEFKVTGVMFIINVGNAPMNWRTSIPMKYSLARMPPADKAEAHKTASAGEAAADETPTYRLKINYVPNETEDRFGDLIISTNLKKKPEIKIPGLFVAGKQ